MTVLNLYLLLNIGVLASYLGFLALRALRAPPALTARVGLLLLAAGVLAPLAIATLPARSLPPLPRVISQPLAESSRPRHTRHHRELPIAKRAAEHPAPAWTPPQIRWELLGDIVLWILALGI